MTGKAANPPIDRAAIAMIAEGARLTYANAAELAREAEILRTAGALARTLFLYQVSLEECAKVETFGAWVTSLLAGHSVDQNRILAGLRSHKAKNHTNAYSLTPTDEELEARARGDWKAAGEAFDQVKREFHIQSNEFRNAALYVDFKQGRFVAPAAVIDEVTVNAIAKFNAQYLEQTALFVRTFDAIERDPISRQAFILDMMRHTESAADPKQAIDAVQKVLKLFAARIGGERQAE